MSFEAGQLPMYPHSLPHFSMCSLLSLSSLRVSRIHISLSDGNTYLEALRCMSLGQLISASFYLYFDSRHGRRAWGPHKHPRYDVFRSSTSPFIPVRCATYQCTEMLCFAECNGSMVFTDCILHSVCASHVLHCTH